jgi:hypothetical protein
MCGDQRGHLLTVRFVGGGVEDFDVGVKVGSDGGTPRSVLILGCRA